MDWGGFTFAFLLFIVLPIILVAAKSSSNNVKRVSTDNNKTLNGKAVDDIIANEFKVTDSDDVVKFYNENIAIAIINSKQKLIVVSKVYSNNNLIIDLNKIISIELDIDGKTVSTPSYAGAAIGNALAGGFGALIGASNMTISKKINSINLKIRVDDIVNPLHKLTFFQSQKPLSKDSHEITSALTNADNWYSRLITIIDKNKHSKHPSQISISTVADEIIKLKKLLDDGAISKDEFESYKNELVPKSY